MRGMTTKIIDSLSEPGGQLAALYPEKLIYDMPGFPKILARDLAREMAEQGLRFGAKTCLGESVQTLQRGAEGEWIIGTSAGTHRTRTVVICAGAGAFTPKRLDVPGLRE